MSIELKNVCFTYPNGFLANENLNLVINQGKRLESLDRMEQGKQQQLN